MIAKVSIRLWCRDSQALYLRSPAPSFQVPSPAGAVYKGHRIGRGSEAFAEGTINRLYFVASVFRSIRKPPSKDRINATLRRRLSGRSRRTVALCRNFMFSDLLCFTLHPCSCDSHLFQLTHYGGRHAGILNPRATRRAIVNTDIIT